MVHVLGESVRHAGHADILREGLDGLTGLRAEHEMQIDEEARAAYRARIEQAARSAAGIETQRLSQATDDFDRGVATWGPLVPGGSK